MFCGSAVSLHTHLAPSELQEKSAMVTTLAPVMATRWSAASTAEAAVISVFFHLHLFTSAFCTFLPDIFSIRCGCMCECGVRTVGKGCSSNNGLLIHSSESSWWIQTTATSWYRERFPLTQVQNVQASWPSAVVFLAEMQAMWGKVTVGLHWPFHTSFICLYYGW